MEFTTLLRSLVGSYRECRATCWVFRVSWSGHGRSFCDRDRYPVELRSTDALTGAFTQNSPNLRVYHPADCRTRRCGCESQRHFRTRSSLTPSRAAPLLPSHLLPHLPHLHYPRLVRPSTHQLPRERHERRSPTLHRQPHARPLHPLLLHFLKPHRYNFRCRKGLSRFNSLPHFPPNLHLPLHTNHSPLPQP